MSDTPEDSVKRLEEVINEGTDWLLQYGVVTPAAHNRILLNIYLNFPQVRYVEYRLDPEDRMIDLYLFVDTWRMLFTNTSKLAEGVLDFLTANLHNFTIRVTVKRFKGQKDLGNVKLLENKD